MTGTLPGALRSAGPGRRRLRRVAVGALLALCLALAPLTGADRVAAQPRQGEAAGIVALVVSTGESGGARADAVQASLQVLGAATLRAIDPNNAELRSQLRRFADAAADTDVALVYIDAPVVALEGRPFVMPAGTTLRRSSDLLTRALPLSAFARAAAGAVEGGGVMVAVGAPAAALPQGVSLATTPPAARAGASPVVLAERGRSDPLLGVLSAAGRDAVVELGALIRAMTAVEGVSTSALPEGAVYLRRPPVEGPEAPEEAAQPEAAAQAVAQTPAVTAVAPAPPEAEPEEVDVEVLAVLEQSISRSAKRRLQRRLGELGFYNGFIDGIFGGQTRASITDWQRAQGYPATGYLTTRQIGELQ
ncbi:MAG: peptidoglycan-binding domain-containing protein [Pseudomonadota bacterium]